MKKGIRIFLSSCFKIQFQHVMGTLIGLGMIAMVMDYLRLYQEYEEFKRSHGEEIVAIKQLKEIKVSLSQIDGLLNRLNKFSSKLKVIAHIPEKNSPQRFAGIWKDPSQNTPDKGDRIFDKEEISTLQRKIQILESEAKWQETTFSDLNAQFIENPTLLTSIPSLRPSSGRISSGFGFRKQPNGQWHLHEGMDIAANYGSHVVAPADGIVEEVSFSPTYGNFLIIDHGYGLKSIFAHTSKVLVKKGNSVKRGTEIALVGGTGHARGVHLHYEVKLNGVPVDPVDYIFNES